MKKLLRSETPIAVALIVLTTILTYAVLIPKLGFYRDDWYLIWAGHSQGASGIIDLFKSDRPFMGFVYAFEYWFLGDRPLAWQIYALVFKIMGGLAFFWLLRLMWPHKKMETTFITLLYVAYPGFLQQPNAPTFQSDLLAAVAAILSFGLMICGIRATSKRASVFFHALALMLTLIYMIVFESLIGLEFARLLLIFYLLYRENKEVKASLLGTLRRLSPYIIVAGSFLFWRLFLFKSTRPATDVGRLVGNYIASPLHALLNIPITLARDVIETIFFAWSVPVYQFTVSADAWNVLKSLLVALLVVGLGLVYFRISHRMGWNDQQETVSENRLDSPAIWMWLGAPIVIAGLIPIVLAGRDIQFAVQWDRYTLHVAIGAALFMGGFVFYFFKSTARWAVLFSLLAVGVVTQYHTAAMYADFWSAQRDLWWQMSWRAPAIEKNTVLVVQLPGQSALAEDYEIYSPADLIYYPEEGLSLSGDVLNSITIPYILRQEVKGVKNRELYVRKNFKNVLIVAVPAPRSCLHVINGEQVELPGYVNPQLLMVAEYSDITRIKTDAKPAVPPASIFGMEPTHDWCFYYQKMDLARQVGNWQEVARLGSEAQKNGVQPFDRSEWMPLFEAYANIGALQDADKIASRIKEDDTVQLLLCKQLERPRNFPSSYPYEYIHQTLCGTN